MGTSNRLPIIFFFVRELTIMLLVYLTVYITLRSSVYTGVGWAGCMFAIFFRSLAIYYQHGTKIWLMRYANVVLKSRDSNHVFFISMSINQNSVGCSVVCVSIKHGCTAINSPSSALFISWNSKQTSNCHLVPTNNFLTII